MSVKNGDKQPLNTVLMNNKLKGDVFPEDWGEFLDEDIRAFFDELIELKGKRRSDIIRRANIPRTFGYQMMEGRRRGKRDYYLCLAIAMSLDLSTTQRMLAVVKCGNLHPLIKRDAAIIFAINNKYDLEQTYDFMIGIDVPPLDTGIENE